MPSSSCPALLLGTSNIGASPLYTHRTPSDIAALLDAFRALGGKHLDTAALYGKSPEEEFGVTERVLRGIGVDGWGLDTKVRWGDEGDRARTARTDDERGRQAAAGRSDGPDFAPGRVTESCRLSLANLGVSQVGPVANYHALAGLTPSVCL